MPSPPTISSRHILLHPNATWRAGRRSMVTLAVLAFLSFAAQQAAAQLSEWRLTDRVLHDRTSRALERYYAVIQADSLRLRYIRNNAGLLEYRLRGLPSANDVRGQIVSVSLGQLTLFPESNVRIALGEDLYGALLDTRTAGNADMRLIPYDAFGHDDWSGDHRIIVALDRFDFRFTPSLGIMAALGAPESNLYWWSDGTARLGITSPDWEAAALLPIGGGLTPIGPLRERRLAPAWGAAGVGRVGPVTARSRFATAGASTFDAPSVMRDHYVHTISAQISYRTSVVTGAGTFTGDLGLGHEEYAQVREVNDTATTRGYIRRLSPLADVRWTNSAHTLQLRFAFVDFTPNVGMRTRLTPNLALEADLACAGLFRQPKPFEHAYYLFITPRVWF